MLAVESNAEVEIVVKYSFEGKPEVSSVFPNECSRHANVIHEVPNRGSQRRHSRKPLIESSATYVQIRNPVSQSPPVSTETRKKIRIGKSQRSIAQPSSSQTLSMKTISSTTGHFDHNSFVSLPQDESDGSTRQAKKSQSMVSCVVGRFVDGKFKSA
ncbi:unnamed protein product [Litomosoides sigmodontis]|uniref:Uncharacterized protein n=1 Tax=Litomosoides sigmodontis TaxID=42156 RepID=A0A3P6SH97_LITSI|nr:unnamed protein product [Litomosoides sigmodontis]